MERLVLLPQLQLHAGFDEPDGVRQPNHDGARFAGRHEVPPRRLPAAAAAVAALEPARLGVLVEEKIAAPGQARPVHGGREPLVEAPPALLLNDLREGRPQPLRRLQRRLLVHLVPNFYEVQRVEHHGADEPRRRSRHEVLRRLQLALLRHVAAAALSIARPAAAPTTSLCAT